MALYTCTSQPIYIYKGNRRITATLDDVVFSEYDKRIYLIVSYLVNYCDVHTEHISLGSKNYCLVFSKGVKPLLNHAHNAPNSLHGGRATAHGWLSGHVDSRLFVSRLIAESLDSDKLYREYINRYLQDRCGTSTLYGNSTRSTSPELIEILLLHYECVEIYESAVRYIPVNSHAPLPHFYIVFNNSSFILRIVCKDLTCTWSSTYSIKRMSILYDVIRPLLISERNETHIHAPALVMNLARYGIDFLPNSTIPSALAFGEIP